MVYPRGNMSRLIILVESSQTPAINSDLGLPKRKTKFIVTGTHSNRNPPHTQYIYILLCMYISFFLDCVLWIPCSRTNPPRKNVETPSVVQNSFLEAMLGELGRLSCLETRHGVESTFRRRILSGGYIAWRILRSGSL